MKRHLYIGLMSGTSLDGVDAALVDLSAGTPRVLGTHFAAFEDDLRARFLNLQTSGPDELARASLAANALARTYADAVDAVLRSASVPAQAVRAIGAHGQTVRHRPDLGFTVQLGNPALLAELTGIDVVADFRSRDVAAGGQGAPLAPAFHRAVFGAPGETRAVLNLGGIANVTVLHSDGSVTGFDTGPANVLLDLWCERHRGTRLDAGGVWAASGAVLPDLLRDLLAEPFFSAPPPKSTGRDLFNEAWLGQHVAGLGTALPQDVQATLAELTATSVAGALGDQGIRAVYLCGGGAHNADLRSRLAHALRPATVDTTATLGVPPDWVEAVAFAWLAARHMEGVASNLPQVTGAAGERVLGALWPAR